ncbi:hypothetical protein FQA47_023364 [Oryzias melastigma]|uniref:Uncharacterized protein n=1 Tax=Oryzias melastigma TaxID=30732 RepID=A0A834FBB8_ORYME|nr:hypothetical protein FQA47_023364 [Oryzias melastigma]
MLAQQTEPDPAGHEILEKPRQNTPPTPPNMTLLLRSGSSSASLCSACLQSAISFAAPPLMWVKQNHSVSAGSARSILQDFLQIIMGGFWRTP